MAKLPKEIKLTQHAKIRLKERAKLNNYNIKNIMRSPCRWYGKDDLIKGSNYYRHCLYACRKSKQIGFITDGNIEVIYNRGTGVAITIMEVKEKFLPVTQYIKPEYLKQIELKKEKKKMRALETKIGTCPDCETEGVELIAPDYICGTCKKRKYRALQRGKEYIPYKELPEKEKTRVDNIKKAHQHRKEVLKTIHDIPLPEIPVIENYYEVKANNNPAIAHIIDKPEITKIEKLKTPMLDQDVLDNTLRDYGCEIPEDSLKDVLNVLISTDKLKNIFMTIAKDDNQQALLDLEQSLNVVERKLQNNWELSGFQELEDMKFKNFLTWRKMLKGAIFFWKKLYQTNTLVELQRAWNAYTSDQSEKTEERMESKLKRFQITTDTLSTIFNTRRPFTRVFYATTKDDAYDQFVKWLSDRQLHEDKSKTTIVELTSEKES